MAVTEIDFAQVQKALDVLPLTEPYSDEDIENAAQAWEATWGQPLMRPDEHDELGQPNAKFYERMQSFSHTPPGSKISGDPTIFRDELATLRQAIDDPKTLTDRTKARINELEMALGEPQTDFTKLRTRKQIQEEAKARYADYQKQPDFQKRIAMIKRERDHLTLQLLYKYDRSDNVNKAAQQRIAELEIGIG